MIAAAAAAVTATATTVVLTAATAMATVVWQAAKRTEATERECVHAVLRHN